MEIIRTDPPLVYAVGEMYIPGDVLRYNLAVWDGSNWTIQRIPYHYGGIDYYHPIQTTIAFNENDIWFAGNGVLRWDGNIYIPVPIPSNVWGQDRIRKMWGSSNTNIYIVGDNGSMAHYDGTQWRKIESGTTLPLRDIFGARIGNTDDYEILCVADSYMRSEGSQVLSIEKDQVKVVWNDGRQNGLLGIWFISGMKYISVGSGYWETTDPSIPFSKDVLASAYKVTVRGLSEHDIIVGGSYKLLAHFDGIEWHSFSPQLSTAGFSAVKMEGDLAVAVGSTGKYALTAIGKR